MQRYRHSILSRNFISTEGIMRFAEEKGAFWFLDIMASHQPDIPTDDHFQLWRLEKTPEGGAVATCRRDTNDPVIVKQEIEYTDFPDDSFECYVILEGGQQICLLKSEY